MESKINTKERWGALSVGDVVVFRDKPCIVTDVHFNDKHEMVGATVLIGDNTYHYASIENDLSHLMITPELVNKMGIVNTSQDLNANTTFVLERETDMAYARIIFYPYDTHFLVQNDTSLLEGNEDSSMYEGNVYTYAELQHVLVLCGLEDWMEEFNRKIGVYEFED